MTETERIINLCVEYFNKHDLDTDDEPITKYRKCGNSLYKWED